MLYELLGGGSGIRIWKLQCLTCGADLSSIGAGYLGVTPGTKFSVIMFQQAGNNAVGYKIYYSASINNATPTMTHYH